MIKKSITQQQKFFLEHVAKFCDKCGKAYHLDDIQIIQEKKSSMIIHFSCRYCKSSNIANLVPPIGLTTRIPINSDLSLNEFSKFTSKEMISLDDILDVHLKLEKNKGQVQL
jgi:hypothetical protein